MTKLDSLVGRDLKVFRIRVWKSGGHPALEKGRASGPGEGQGPTTCTYTKIHKRKKINKMLLVRLSMQADKKRFFLKTAIQIFYSATKVLFCWNSSMRWGQVTILVSSSECRYGREISHPCSQWHPVAKGTGRSEKF